MTVRQRFTLTNGQGFDFVPSWLYPTTQRITTRQGPPSAVAMERPARSG